MTTYVDPAVERRRAQEKIQDEAREKALEIMGALAKRPGFTIPPSEYGDATRVQRADGFGWSVGTNWGARSHMLTVHALRPPVEYYASAELTWPEFNISSHRPVADAIREIDRRTLDYVASWDRALGKQEALDERRKNAADVAADIAGVFDPTRIPVHRRTEGERTMVWTHLSADPRAYGAADFDVHAYAEGPSVSIKAHGLPPELAMAIARTIEDYRSAR